MDKIPESGKPFLREDTTVSFIPREAHDRGEEMGLTIDEEEKPDEISTKFEWSCMDRHYGLQSWGGHSNGMNLHPQAKPSSRAFSEYIEIAHQSHKAEQKI